MRYHDNLSYANGLCMLSGGLLAVSVDMDDHKGVTFVATRTGCVLPAASTRAASRASSLATKQLSWPMGMAQLTDGILVCNFSYEHEDEGGAGIYKFAKTGAMAQLAFAPAYGEYERGFRVAAVHQSTQCIFALAGSERGDGNPEALVKMSSDLQVLDVIERVEGDDSMNDSIQDIAVCGDEVIMLTGRSYDDGSGLRILDLDGNHQRTLCSNEFRRPWAMAAADGRIHVVDNDSEANAYDDEDHDEGTVDKILHVIDIQAGSTLQKARIIDLPDEVSDMIVDNNLIYISAFHAGVVSVLRFAGCE